MNLNTKSVVEITRHSETQFRAFVDGFGLWVTQQEDGRHFLSVKDGESYLETHSGTLDTQAEAVLVGLRGIELECESRIAPITSISPKDVKVLSRYHTLDEILAATMQREIVQDILRDIHKKIANPDNWKSPVRIQREDGFPVRWIEAACAHFGGCTLGNGLHWVGDNNDYLYYEGYYAKIGA